MGTFLPGPNPMMDPQKGENIFGKIAAGIRKLLKPETEETPLQLSYGTDAEARGYGDSPFRADTQSLAAWAYDKMRLEAGRFAAYRDYEIMDSETPEISAALDVIAEFATQNDDSKAETFNIESESDEFARYLSDVVEKLQLERYITPTAREIAKYGCSFWELVIDENQEYSAIKPLPPITMLRNEDKYGVLATEAFTQIDPASQKPVAHFLSWQVVQGRYQKMLGRMYGNSILEPCRKTHKQLNLIEDGMVIGRLYRSHMRYIFQIPVDGMAADAAESYLMKKKQQFRKRQKYNSGSNKTEMFDSPISADEDFFMGVRKEGVPGKVETIQGQGGMSDIGDIEYFQNKIFSTMGVPKSLLGYERDVNAKATLTQQDVNFARKLRRMQQVAAGMIKEVLTRCMILDGKDPDNVPNWSIIMPVISTTDDLRQAQIEALRANVALIYGNQLPVVDKEYIWKTIMKLSQEEYERISTPGVELGVEAMPMPAPPVDPNAEAATEVAMKVASKPTPPPAAKGPVKVGTLGKVKAPMKSTTAESLEIPALGDASDEAIVMRLRRALEINDNTPPTSGELNIAQLLRDMDAHFGVFAIDDSALSTAFTQARNGHH